MLCDLLTAKSKQVGSKIGKGAYGSVWQATIVQQGLDIVLKVVFPDPDLIPEETSQPSEEKLTSFRREIEIMSVLGEHPNILGLIGITSDYRVLVLQEAKTDLHQMIKHQRRSLLLPMVWQWSQELLPGVAYLHSRNVMHRDLKPSNLLLFEDGTVKICDFGLSRGDIPSTESLSVCRETSTLWYRAPELIMGDLIYTSKIDMWSVGCIMLEMIAGSVTMAGRVEDVCNVRPPLSSRPMPFAMLESRAS